MGEPYVPRSRRGVLRGLGLVLAVGAPTLAHLLLAIPPRGQLVEDPGRLVTEHFVHTFDPARVNRNALTVVKTDYDFTYDQLRSTPSFVRETAFHLEQAVRAYESHGVHFAGLFADAVPYPKQILVVYPTSIGFPMQYSHDFGTINVRPARPGSGFTLALHRRRTAHELFHAIQGRTIGGKKCTSRDGLWWIEATAEYAACDVVCPDLSKQKGNGRAYPYLLEVPLADTGIPSNTHNLDFGEWKDGEEIEYDKGFFVQYLVDHARPGSPASAGARFFALNDAVLARYAARDGRAAILDALDKYIFANSPESLDLSGIYRQFAAHYLLGAQSPLVGVQLTRAKRPIPATPLVGVVRSLSGRENDVDRLLAPQPGVDSRPLEYAFRLRNGYTAQMWAVEADPPATGSAGSAAARQVRVTAVRLEPNGGTLAQVFKGRRGQWLPGQPAPAVTLRKSGDAGRISLSPGETLYVIATATNEADDGAPEGHLAGLATFDAGSGATVRVEDVTAPPPPPRPPTPTTTPKGAPTTRPPSTSASGYWKLIESRSLKYALPGAASTSISVSDGSISGKVTTTSNDEGPSTWAGSCSWTMQSPGGLDRLLPGARIDASMTVTDTSVPEKVSGWNHGHVGVSGSIRFDMPYLALGASHGSASDLVNVSVGWTKSESQKGTWTVPAGPVSAEWQGKAAIDANCGFGRFERVYVWTTGPYVPGETSSAPPSAPSRPSFAGSWTGTWTNDVGEKGKDTLVLEEAADGTLSGLWSGNVPVSGRRVDATTAELQGRTNAREYEVRATLSGGVMTLRYVARRSNATGGYRGTSTLARAE